MKKTLIVGIATLSLTLGAYGQGSINIDNGASLYGPTLDVAGNYFGGVFGLEVWYQNGTAFPLASVNSLAGTPGGNLTAYGIVDGWTLAATWVNQDNSVLPGAGFLTQGAINIPGVTPAGSTITLALAMWTGSGASFTGAAKGGVVAMQVLTANYNDQPVPVPGDISAGWDGAGTDLIMTDLIPEPSSLSLAAMGLAALLIRRRK
jgi:hypothetical protein